MSPPSSAVGLEKTRRKTLSTTKGAGNEQEQIEGRSIITGYLYNKKTHPELKYGNPTSDDLVKSLLQYHKNGFIILDTTNDKNLAEQHFAQAKSCASEQDFTNAAMFQTKGDSLQERVDLHDKLFHQCIQMKDKSQQAMNFCADYKLFTQANEWKEVFDAVQSLLDKSTRELEETIDCQEQPEEVVQVNDDQVVATTPPRTSQQPEEEILFELATPSKNSRKRSGRSSSKGSNNELSSKKKSKIGEAKRAEKKVITEEMLNDVLKKRDLENHFIVFRPGGKNGGFVYCDACNVKLSWTNIVDHSKGIKHGNRVGKRIKASKAVKQSFLSVKKEMEDDDTIGSKTVADYDRMMRLEYVKLMCDANISSEAMGLITNFISLCKARVNLGDARSRNDHIKYAHIAEKKKLKELLHKKLTGAYAITIDCSPYSFCAEAMMIRRLHPESWEIVELLAGLKLYENSPNGENTAGALYSYLTEYELNPQDWIAAMMDGCSVNTKAINDLTTKVNNLHVKKVLCLSHFFSNVGGKMECKELGKMLKYLRQMNLSTRCRKLFSNSFNQNFKAHKTVRWYSDFEFISQLNDIGLENVIEFVKEANINSWAEKSTTKLIQYIDSDPQIKAKIIVAMAAISYVGKPLCEACYLLEGNQNLIFCADAILEGVEMHLGRTLQETFDFGITDGALNDITTIIATIAEETLSPYLAEVDNAVATLRMDENNLLECTRKVNDLKAEKEAIQTTIEHNQQNARSREQQRRGQISSTQRASRRYRQNHNYNDMNSGRTAERKEEGSEEEARLLEDINSRMENAILSFNHAREAKESSEKALAMVKSTLEDMERDTLSDNDDIKAFANAIVKPCAKYFGQNFFSDNGSLTKFRTGLRGVRVFDPKYIHVRDVVTLEQYIDDLASFEISKINETLRAMMKSELADLKGDVSSWEIDFDKICKDLNVVDEEHDENFVKWEDDHSMHARCIWKWWGSKYHKYPGFGSVVRSIALLQTSSASVERVFSQLKLIVGQIGQSALEDNFELRLMRRVNKEFFGTYNN